VRLAERRARRFLEEMAQGTLTRITLPPVPTMCRKTYPLRMRPQGFSFVLLKKKKKNRPLSQLNNPKMSHINS